jgi:hypothetical protein
MREGTCKLCFESAKLVESHVIPNAFTKHISQDGTGRSYSSNAEDFERKMRQGIVDEHLVCNTCERIFDAPDRFAITTLKKTDWSKFPLQRTLNGGEYRIIESIDTTALRFFFHTILWRCATTSHHFCEQAKFGPRVEYLRKLVLSKTTTDNFAFPMTLTRFYNEFDDDPVGPETGIMSPSPIRRAGHWYMYVYVGAFRAIIKTDGRPTDANWKRLALHSDRPMCLQEQPWMKSQEHEEAMQVARARIRRNSAKFTQSR